jgi:hypothetical protein
MREIAECILFPTAPEKLNNIEDIDIPENFMTKGPMALVDEALGIEMMNECVVDPSVLFNQNIIRRQTMSDERKKEVLSRLAETVVKFDEDMAKKWFEICIDEGIEALEAVIGGLAVGMEKVGELYDQQEYFVPELLMSADPCMLDWAYPIVA